jgi:hypothetical protein
LGILFATTALKAQGTAVVSGTVRDENNAPIREALVVIDPDSLSLRTRTGADGRYRLTVPVGRFEIRIVRIGHRPFSQVLDVNSGSVTFDVVLRTVPIQLDNVTVRVSRPGLYGRIMSRGIELLPHEPTPIRAVNIEVLNEPYRVKSEADGRFSIPDLPIGAHSVLVALDHYVSRLIPVTVPPEGGVEMTITLDSLYADYQRREELQKREISWRMRRASSPATFVSAHDLDSTAKDLRQALRWAESALSRGMNFMDPRIQYVIFIDGQRTYLQRPNRRHRALSVEHARRRAEHSRLLGERWPPRRRKAVRWRTTGAWIQQSNLRAQSRKRRLPDHDLDDKDEIGQRPEARVTSLRNVQTE